MNGRELLVFAASTTVTCATAPAARSAAVIAAVNCVALPNVVTRAEPFHITVELPVKPVPVTVTLVAVPGAFAENGERLLTTKAGVFGPGPRLRSQTPRPCVAARRVREGLCRTSDKICALGIEFCAPRGNQFSPPSVVRNAPISVPTYNVL